VGPIPDKLCVLHKCDNPPCNNQEHWFLGTRRDNAKDRDNKGRTTKGTGIIQAVLSEEEVREVRSMLAQGLPQQVIADVFGVAQGTVWRIKESKSWGWLV